LTKSTAQCLNKQFILIQFYPIVIFVLVSTKLTKLCCFKHDNLTVLLLPKMLQLLTMLSVY